MTTDIRGGGGGGGRRLCVDAIRRRNGAEGKKCDNCRERSQHSVNTDVDPSTSQTNLFTAMRPGM